MLVKYLCTIILCFLSWVSTGQNLYTSSYTQTWPTIFNSRIVEKKHSISFEENAIVLATETPIGKEIETFYIQEILETNGATEFHCLTGDNQLLTIVKPAREKIHFIDIFRRSPKSGEEIQIRLHLN